ncbi:DUF433 domain-containing protein [Syntrophothermus sp.]|uniref:DUF433 domain-containing protein n=1 Tax=Syntrophothermus sp. TaxID=2736299 RepID=UPI00257C11BB|nr:DUF433 domain-containing protein [Syntrophothermus sp.]
MKLDRITVNPQISMGQPTIRGTRFTVAFILKLLASGMDIPAILNAYPELEEEDIRQSLMYGAWLATEQTRPIPWEAQES